MCDEEVFAVLTPCDQCNLARKAFRLKENVNWYSGAAEGAAEEPTIGSRDPTPAPQSSSEGKFYSADRLLLTLNEKPKNPLKGWQFGTDLFSSDVLLGYRGTRGVSGRHFRITITEDLWVELHDDSTYGTAVSYDGRAKNKARIKNTWTLSCGPRQRRQFKDVTIYVPDADGLAFKIEFPNHEAGGTGYLAHLRTFLEESKTALPPVNTIGLDSNPTTAAPSQPQTPHQRPVHIDDGLIGQGQFGEVRKIIDTRNLHSYATKKFHPPQQIQKSRGKRKRDEEQWLEKIRNEIAIMEKNPHPNVMPLIDFQETPDPVLMMPYYPLGNLQDIENVSEKQYVSAFRQILLGLRHLHGRGIAHRDLKPENILIKEPFTIIIADFGLSKITLDCLLKTFCGTHLYAAPEVYPGNNNGYGPLVDIWSTGVIMLELIYGAPSRPNMKGIKEQEWNKHWSKCWSKALIEKVNDLNENGDKVIDILIHMVKINPQERFTADQCLEKGCDNGVFRKRYNGDIVDEDTSEVNSLDDEIPTPTQQSPRETGSGADIGSLATTILEGDLWGEIESRQENPANSPLIGGQTTRASCSGSLTRRQRTMNENVKSWSLTIGPSNSDSDGGFDLETGRNWDRKGKMTGLFIKRDHFTPSFESGFTCTDETREEGRAEQTGLTENTELEQKNATGIASFEKRILELLA
ncbi:hypothetical protein MMC24_003033 [Lignoscripta atroalba]|nr:hypothetical protein [Lignoscripta atroalba]